MTSEKTKLLTRAQAEIKRVPHVYHGQLRRAMQDIQSAIDEWAGGDPAHKVREDIFDADDQIKSIM